MIWPFKAIVILGYSNLAILARATEFFEGGKFISLTPRFNGVLAWRWQCNRFSAFSCAGAGYNLGKSLAPWGLFA